MDTLIKLKKLQEEQKKIKVGLVGTGQMGKVLVSQMRNVPGMEVVFLCSRTAKKAKDTFENGGISSFDIIEINKKSEAEDAVSNGKYAVTDDYRLLTECENLDVIVEATGNVEVGADIAYRSILHQKHTVMLNVEADVTVGNYLNHLAQKNHVTYTGTAGDEPGAILDLVRFAENMGLEVIVAGKGKNNPLNVHAVAEDVLEAAKIKGTNPTMLTSFVDGTKTMIEMNAVANAIGFLPDKRGMHGVKSDVAGLNRIFSLKEEGGILDGYRRVDFVNGIAPGVFVIVTTKNKDVVDLMKYLSLGDGPNYTLYRPYHLTCLETPITIANAYFNGMATIAPKGKTPFAETVAVAKRDLMPGESLDEIGGYTVYGTLETFEKAKKENMLPVGLCDAGIKVKKAIKRDTVLTYDMVEITKESEKVRLRKLQDALIDSAE